MIPIVTPAEMAAIDADAPEPVEELIDRAGRAVARVALDMLGGAYGRVVTVIAGTGNNGADGRTAGDVLRRRGVQVRVVEATSCPPTLSPCDLVIDAAFGTGFHGQWIAPTLPLGAGSGGTPPQRPAVLAVDIPSGVDAATGEAGAGVLRADRTVTFQALKPGLVFGAGRQLSGEITVADIGLDVSRGTAFLVGADDVADWQVSRAVDAHKWHRAVRVIAGSRGMLGAGELCAAAAARTGAGLVALSSPGAETRARSEIIDRRLSTEGFADTVLEDLHRFAALAVGPGLGREQATIASVRRLIAEAEVPIVVDGDGLFAAAQGAGGAGALFRERQHPCVVTPHDGEYAVLDGAPPVEDRIAAALTLANELGCTVLLKGPATVIAHRGQPVYVVTHGDERLATAGTGDVLTGMVAAQLAAGMAPTRAAASAAWLHAEAARRGPARGMLAGDLIDRIPAVLDAS